MLFRPVAIASCSFILLTLLGCNPKLNIKTVPVSGTVKHNGQPVVGAVVNFINTAEGGRSAGGFTDAQGKFTLTTPTGGSKSQDGAVEGNYTVTVSAKPVNTFGAPGTDVVDPSAVSEEQIKAMQGKMAAMKGTQEEARDDPGVQRKAVEQQEPKSTLPAKYADITTSPFKDYAVKAGDNKFDLELTDD